MNVGISNFPRSLRKFARTKPSIERDVRQNPLLSGRRHLEVEERDRARPEALTGDECQAVVGFASVRSLIPLDRPAS
jgi:hypothetical protein